MDVNYFGMNESENVIESVVVVPRNQRYASFFLNGGTDAHTMKWSELRQYLLDLDPNNAYWIEVYIAESRIFVLFPELHEIKILRPEDKTIDELFQESLEELREPPKKSLKPRTLAERSKALMDKLYAKNWH